MQVIHGGTHARLCTVVHGDIVIALYFIDRYISALKKEPKFTVQLHSIQIHNSRNASCN